VFVETWRGQGHQKNRAVELAQGPWIFSVDADERVTPALAAEIQAAIAGGELCAFAMRRKNYYRDQWINHCGWWPDWVKRVFLKRRGAIQRGCYSRFPASAVGCGEIELSAVALFVQVTSGFPESRLLVRLQSS
jgi:glycosyltransferase involved in cell wall biosynthesis